MKSIKLCCITVFCVLAIFLSLLFDAQLAIAEPAPAASADNVQILFESTLSGRAMTYQVYLPAKLPTPVPAPVAAARDFNQSGDIIPFDNDIRIYWELTVSYGSVHDNNGGKVLVNPELVIAPAINAETTGDAVSNPANQAWVNESFCGETRAGSFILPARAGMAVRLQTGSWDKHTALLSHHPQAFFCQLKIYCRPADRDLPPGLQHINAPLFNQFINSLIKDRENTIKKPLLNENLYDLIFRKVDFRIETGELFIGFTAFYKGRSVLGIPFRTQAEGTASFEVRCSSDGARLGLYCRGLVGPFDIAHDFGLLDQWGKTYINSKILNQQYWTPLHPTPDVAAANDPPASYLVFKNDNLTAIVNQGLLAGRLRPVSYDFPGGTAQLLFREVSFQEFNLAAGRAKGLCRLDAAFSLLGQDIYRVADAGTISPLELDFYTDSADQAWWVRITGFHVELNGISAIWNGLINQIVSAKLAESHGLMRLNLPSLLSDSEEK